MNLALWIIASLLALVFLAGGAVKLIVPKPKIAATPLGAWAEDFGPGGIKAIGLLEVLAAIGLILPALTGIAPIFVPLAALGLVLMMGGAMITHLRRGERKPITINLIYLVLAAIVVWGRFGPASFGA